MANKAKKAPPTKDKDVKELNLFIKALQGTEHNPVQWAAVFRVAAPIIARLAARTAAGYLASKWGKRASPKTRGEVAAYTAERIAAIFIKQLLK